MSRNKQLTSLGRAKVLSGSGSSGLCTAGLLDAQSAAFVGLALEGVLGSIGLVGGDHLDEAESTRLAGVGVAHDAAGLDFTVLDEETTNLVLGEAGVDAGDEEVGARVDGLLFVLLVGGAGLGGGTASSDQFVLISLEK